MALGRSRVIFRQPLSSTLSILVATVQRIGMRSAIALTWVFEYHLVFGTLQKPTSHAQQKSAFLHLAFQCGKPKLIVERLTVIQRPTVVGMDKVELRGCPILEK